MYSPPTLLFIVLCASGVTAWGADPSAPAAVAGQAEGLAVRVIPLDVKPHQGVLGMASDKVTDGSDFLRLKLLVVSPQSFGDVSLTVSDSYGKTVDTMSLKGSTGVTEYWTKIIPGNAYSLSVTGPSQAPGSSVTVWRVLRSIEPPTALSIVNGFDDRKPITQVADPLVKAAARAVVKLFIQEGDLTESCTGFLIGPQIVMTNRHCLATAADCANTVALFDYDTSTMVPASQQRRCRQVEHSSQTYDYTTFDLDSPPDPTINALSFGTQSAVDGQALTVIEHPGGEPKQVTYTHCTASHDPVNGYGANSDFTHTCATLTGASGSPMLDASMKVVGLHHLGQTDDERIYNRAVRIEPIIADLKTSVTQ